MTDDVYIQLPATRVAPLPLGSVEIVELARRVVWNPAQVPATELRMLALAVLEASGHAAGIDDLRRETASVATR